jgi:predicted O-methyltransferase YrrM
MTAIQRDNLSIRERLMDAVLFAIVVPAAFVLRAYRRRDSAKFPRSTRVLKKIGVFPIIDHYYEPMFNHSSLTRPLSDDRDLPGIDLNVDGQLDRLSKLNFSSELIAMKLDRPPADLTDFCIDNPSYGPGDAEFLYQIIRSIKPRKIIEIGSGYSTKLARIALIKNHSESGQRATHTCIEPYEMGWLEKVDGIQVIRERVEACGLDWAKELSSGDLLFVDSSHMIRPQGDVLNEYLEIFPLLASGVYIHIHDIFTPKDYPHQWIVNDVLFWNEQYLLEALLSNTERYEIVGAVNYLKHHHYEELRAICPYLTAEREPGSFYIRVR